jgi:hypothetical protein
LEALSAKTERTKTDLIREFIRSLQAKVWSEVRSNSVFCYLVAG